MAFSKPHLLALSLSLIGLGGCVSVLPEPTAPDALFAIEPVERPLALNAHIIIREPDAPSIYAGKALVSEDESGALRLLPSAEWAGRATRQMQLALVDSFEARAEAAAMLPEAGTFAPYELSVRVQRLSARGQEAGCVLTATLIQQSGRQIIAQQLIEQTAQAPDNRSSTRAYAIKDVAEACMGEVAYFVSQSLSD